MNKAQNKFNWPGSVVVFTLLLIALNLTSCTTRESPPFLEQEQAAVEVSAADVQATEQAAAASEANGGEAVVEETAVAQTSPDECLTCHTDKEMLIATADPEEEVINENEGEG
ncbi:MAG: hypothetical protein P8183_06885 [Anaerolineae bacterium]